MTDEFQHAILALDQTLAKAGVEIWTGSEPTFSDRGLETPEWLYDALGGDKEARARQLLERLLERQPNALVLRTLGRQYRGEAVPRWNYGVYLRRNGAPVWTGPPEPLAGGQGCSETAFRAFADALSARLQERDWGVARVPGSAEDIRLVLHPGGKEPAADPAKDKRLLRDSVHGQRIPLSGLRDELAATGNLLLILTQRSLPELELPIPEVELPTCADVKLFLVLAEALGLAARDAQLSGLMLTGFPPPVDADIAWITVTPDPAVVEVNQAPSPDLEGFLDGNRKLYAAAAEVGLSPYRLQYNGTQTDSGGGGQITLGGPSPEASPFLCHPQLLPRLIRFLTRHPSLSYWFGPAFLGSSSQAPRVDEGVRDNFLELGLVLQRLKRKAATDPERLWASLSPYLCDPSGNPHRSELNIEKLWNPYLPDRGCLGLVEFRALRMGVSPNQATALAALLKSLAAFLIEHDPVPELMDWGDELHQRFALPYYLLQDLREVLADLEAGGFGLPPPVSDQLLEAELRQIGSVELDGWHFELTSALEFWPLLGDVASQEDGGSRLMDSSNGRIQLLMRPLQSEGADPEKWTISLNGYRLRLRPEQDSQGPLRLIGIRYRRFEPLRGLHPGIPSQAPLEIVLSHPELPRSLRLCAYEWRPGRQPYPGLPADRQDAQCRRRERFVYHYSGPAAPSRDAPASAYGPYSFDLRHTAPG